MMSATIRFVGNDAEGLPLKRKQSRSACESCRKRKKRCSHHPDVQHVESQPILSSQEMSAQYRTTTGAISTSQNRVPDARSHASPANASSTTSQSRIQHFSPVTTGPILVVPAGHVATESSEEAEEDEDRDPRFVGELNPEGIFVAGASPLGAPPTASASSPEDVVGIWVPRKLVNAAKALPGPIAATLLPYLETECFKLLPVLVKYNALQRIYVEEIHPIFPVLDIDSFSRQQDRSKSMLQLAVCLLVSSNPKAGVFLKQSPKDFTTQATQLLRSAVDNGLVRDKQVIMQLLITLALSTQLSNDRHASAEYTSRAVSYVHTGGLHLNTATRSDDSNMTRLFCCVFALDRLSAAVQGRPVLMHERDIGRDMVTCVKQQDNLFQLLLRVVMLLDKVIALYRPTGLTNENTNDKMWSMDQTFPTFEDLLNDSGPVRSPAASVATVETLYHAVAMLSCRSQSLSELSRSSALHTRQSLSAASIMSIAGNEYRGQLSVLPFVPYAMSLALRVTYRDLRLSKSPFTRTRARRQLLHICALIRDLGETFSSSLHMVDLAEQTVREMDKAYSSVAGQRRESLAPTATDARGNEPISTQYGQDMTAPRGATGLTTPVRDPELTRLSDNHDIPVFDTTQFEFEFDLDIFDHFDPDFDIQAIDTALANSIDPALPMDISSWA